MTATAESRTAPPARRSAFRELASSAGTILVKELRSRFRGRRAFLVLTLYLAVLALIAYGAYAVEGPTAREEAVFGDLFGAGRPNASARVGQAIFTVLSLIQLLLVSFIAPAFTAGAISLEREKQTLDLLIATPMRPAGIVIGKLIAALGFVLLLIVAGIPVSALVLMYGGATVDDILRQQVVLLASAVGFGVIGLFFSALLKRTQTATVLTYSTLLVLTIGSLMIWRFWGAVATADENNIFVEPRNGPEVLLYLNPAVAMIEIVANTELEFGDFSEVLVRLRGDDLGFLAPANGGGSSEPAEPLDRRPEPEINVVDGAFSRPLMPVDLLGQPEIAPTGTFLVSNHFWPRVTAGLGLVAVVLTLASMRLVGATDRPLALRRRERGIPTRGDAIVDEVEA